MEAETKNDANRRAWARRVTRLSRSTQNDAPAGPAIPCKSTTHTSPTCSRVNRVCPYRSGLFEFAITGPGASQTAQIANAAVLPIRVPANAAPGNSHGWYTITPPDTVTPSRTP